MSLSSFRIIIPARFASSRLPGKALMDIDGKPMIQHVYERGLESGAQSIVIAADHPDIKAVAENFGAQVCMTSFDHQSGSERLAQAVDILNYSDDDIIVNLQCDEPLISPLVIRQLAEDISLHNQPDVMSTLYEYIDSMDDLFNPAIVKTVLNEQGFALYFSRSPIPWIPPKLTEIPRNTYLRHVGIYAYQVRFLKQYINWNFSPLEKIESLEQLRILWNGGRIHLTLAKQSVPSGVNTFEDLMRVRDEVKVLNDKK